MVLLWLCESYFIISVDTEDLLVGYKRKRTVDDSGIKKILLIPGYWRIKSPIFIEVYEIVYNMDDIKDYVYFYYYTT